MRHFTIELHPSDRRFTCKLVTHHFDDHEEFGPQTAVGGVQFQQTYVEDDAVNAVDDLGLLGVGAVCPRVHDEGNQGQTQVYKVKELQHTVPVTNFTLECRWRKCQ